MVWKHKILQYILYPDDRVHLTHITQGNWCALCDTMSEEHEGVTESQTADSEGYGTWKLEMYQMGHLVHLGHLVLD